MPKQIFKKIHKNTAEVFCVCVLDNYLGVGPTLKCGLFTQWDSIGENWFFPLPADVNGYNFLVRGGTLSTPPQC